jgi:AcrR family transcriptional regulator
MNRPYHHGNLRAALLEAARGRLAEGAEADLSLRDLALRVGVSVNATYRHFASKEALLMELAAQGFEALTSRMQEAIEARGGTAPVDRLRVAGEAYTEFARTDPALFRLMFGRKGRFSEHSRFRVAGDAAFQVVIDCVAAILRQPSDSSQVLKAAVTAWALVHGYATLDVDGYLQALPESGRPTAQELVRMLHLDEPSVARPAGGESAGARKSGRTTSRRRSTRDA